MGTWTSKIGTTVPKTSLHIFWESNVSLHGRPLILGAPIKTCSSCLAKPEGVALMMMKSMHIQSTSRISIYSPSQISQYDPLKPEHGTEKHV